MPTTDTAVEKRHYGQRMIFTGPDGIRHYRPRSNYFSYHIGEGHASPEATGDLAYLFRAAPLAPPPTPKQDYVGEIGWGWKYNEQLNEETLFSNVQIKKTEIRTAVEDTISHRFQPNKQKMENTTVKEKSTPTDGQSVDVDRTDGRPFADKEHER